MIEVLFGESEGGSMKVAKNYNVSSSCAVGWIGEGKKPSKKELNKMFEGKPVGGSSSEVICLPFMLDIGKIQIPIEDEYRKELMLDMYSNGRIDRESLRKELEEVWVRYLEEIERLKAYIASGEQIRIWYSNAPYSLCGFYFTCYLLQKIKCDLSVIKLPEYKYDAENRITTSYSSWGEIEAGKFYQFLPLERSVSDDEKSYFSSKWQDLKEDNSPLRAVINGKLTGVSDDFYDFIIRKELPDEEFVMARLIGDILGKYPIGIGDWWYAKRIKWMIERGEIEVIDKKEDTYSQILKKTPINGEKQ